MILHPMRAQQVLLRKTEVARQKAIVDQLWASKVCAICGCPVERPGVATSARAVGHVRFRGPQDVAHGRLLCGRHFYAGSL